MWNVHVLLHCFIRRFDQFAADRPFLFIGELCNWEYDPVDDSLYPPIGIRRIFGTVWEFLANRHVSHAAHFSFAKEFPADFPHNPHYMEPLDPPVLKDLRPYASFMTFASMINMTRLDLDRTKQRQEREEHQRQQEHERQEQQRRHEKKLKKKQERELIMQRSRELRLQQEREAAFQEQLRTAQVYPVLPSTSADTATVSPPVRSTSELAAEAATRRLEALRISTTPTTAVQTQPPPPTSPFSEDEYHSLDDEDLLDDQAAAPRSAAEIASLAAAHRLVNQPRAPLLATSPSTTSTTSSTTASAASSSRTVASSIISNCRVLLEDLHPPTQTHLDTAEARQPGGTIDDLRAFDSSSSEEQTEEGDVDRQLEATSQPPLLVYDNTKSKPATPPLDIEPDDILNVNPAEYEDTAEYRAETSDENTDSADMPIQVNVETSQAVQLLTGVNNVKTSSLTTASSDAMSVNVLTVAPATSATGAPATASMTASATPSVMVSSAAAQTEAVSSTAASADQPTVDATASSAHAPPISLSPPSASSSVTVTADNADQGREKFSDGLE